MAIRQFIPDWEKDKLGAGKKRNAEMAQYADALVLVWDGASKGSKHMLGCAERLGLKIYVHQVNLKGYRRDR